MDKNRSGGQAGGACYWVIEVKVCPPVVRRNARQQQGCHQLTNKQGVLDVFSYIGASGSICLQGSRSRSYHLTPEALVARYTSREMQILKLGGQAPDHLIHPAIPETVYLNAVFARFRAVHLIPGCRGAPSRLRSDWIAWMEARSQVRGRLRARSGVATGRRA